MKQSIITSVANQVPMYDLRYIISQTSIFQDPLILISVIKLTLIEPLLCASPSTQMGWHNPHNKLMRLVLLLCPSDIEEPRHRPSILSRVIQVDHGRAGCATAGIVMEEPMSSAFLSVKASGRHLLDACREGAANC